MDFYLGNSNIHGKGLFTKKAINPLDKEPDGTTAIADEVKSICTAAWTTAIKDAWKAKLIADKSSTIL